MAVYLAGVALAAGMVVLASIPPGAGSPSEKRETSLWPPDRPRAAMKDPGQLLDQPIPVPGRHWQGWDRYPTGRCAWMPALLADHLDAARPPRPTPTGCVVPVSGGTTVNISWGLPEKRLRWHTPTTPNMGERVTTVAGLEARTAKTFLLSILFPGLCRVDLNTRSITGLAILAWNPYTAVNSCEIATTAAELIARARVPAAGGTPWPDTPQEPAPSALIGRGSCELLTAGLAILDEPSTDKLAISETANTTKCQFIHAGVHVQVNVTAASYGDHAPTDGTDRRLGPLAAWETHTAGSCTITTELSSAYLLSVSYHDSTIASPHCAASELITAAAVQTLLDRTAA